MSGLAKKQEQEQPAIIPEIVATKKGQLLFATIARFFYRVEESKGKSKSTFIKNFVKAVFAHDRSPGFVYSVLRLILPSDDRERGNYGLKEKNLAKHICGALGLGKVQFDRMKHFKNPAYHKSGQSVGDFAGVVEQLVGGFCPRQGTISIDALNSILDGMAEEQKHQELLIELLKRIAKNEIRWLIRIILKDLKIGVRTQTVLEAYHPDALEYFNLTNSLKQVSNKFKDPDTKLEKELLLFNPIKPMLASKKQLSSLRQYLPLLVQTKFDGQRIQVHFTRDRITLFSRNGKNYTHIYKQVAGLLQKSLDCDGCILDGEMVALEVVRGPRNEVVEYRGVEFGMNKTISLNQPQGEDDKFTICYKVFDLLWVRGKGEELNLMAHDLARRKRILKKVLNPTPGRIEIVEGLEAGSLEEIEERFRCSMEAGEEGLVLKRTDSPYIPNDRSCHWFKLKGDYIQGLTDSMDLLIIGAYYGDKSYRTAQSMDPIDRVTRFLLGVVVELEKSDPLASRIIPFCKVGTGYNANELTTLRNKLRPALSPSQPPHYVEDWKPAPDDKPDFWVTSPDKSVVLEVKSAQLIKSNTFCYHLTPRFPRVLKIRYDKDWHQAMQVKELEQLSNAQLFTKNMRKRARDSDQEEERQAKEPGSKPRTRKVKARTKEGGRGEVLPWFVEVAVEEVTILSQLFKGFDVLLVGIQGGEKVQLQKLVVQHSGMRSQNYLPSVTHIVAHTADDFRIQAIINNLGTNMPLFVNPDYLYACAEEDRVLHPNPVFCLLPLYESDIKNYDCYGDSFFAPTCRREFRLLLQHIRRTKADPELARRVHQLVCGAGLPALEQEKLPQNLEEVEARILLQLNKFDKFILR